jgi:uncharacterized protein (TIGR03084 family)
MRQAQDFLEECEALAAALEPLGEADYARKTQFKDWTVGDVIGHLHMWNVGADLSLQGDAAFAAFFAPVADGLAEGKSLRQIQIPWLGDLAGRALFDAWRDGYRACAARFAKADPKQRLKWAGPDMSARSSITARQMETWAHGHEIFDLLGQTRTETDRLRNIAHLGATTFAWTYINRGEPVPETIPYIRLAAPSGAVWEWNEPRADERIEGSALGFCQTVTQTRNVADTDIRTTGTVAADWMAKAQCFAGPTNDPPPPGARFVAQS